MTPEQGRRLLEYEQPVTPRELRDHAMLAMLIGCGLRRGELLALTLESIQQREEHWVIADLVGKGGHVRTVPIPEWVKCAVDAWTVVLLPSFDLEACVAETVRRQLQRPFGNRGAGREEEVIRHRFGLHRAITAQQFETTRSVEAIVEDLLAHANRVVAGPRR